MVGPDKLRRRRVTVVIMAIMVTLLTLLSLELGLRLVLGNLDVAPFVLEPGDGRCVALEPGGQSEYTGMVLRIPPVVHAVNEAGYRGPVRPMQVELGRVRVVALGDSFTFGQGIADDEALPAALEAELHERGRSNVEVLNFGVPGLNLRESVDQYRYFARQWQPSVVVMFLFENDLGQPLCEIVGRRAFMWMTRHSRVFRLGVITLAPESLGDPNAYSSEARIEQLREELAELRDDVASDGGRLLLVSIADPLADDAATRQLAEDLGIPALLFDRETYESYETIPNESHWTAAATRSVATQIADWMLSELPAG